MQTLTQDHLSTRTGNNTFIVSTSELSQRLGSMTAREMEILELLGKGLSMKGASRELDISVGTVKWHIRNIYHKLDACSRDEALSKARQRQLIR